MTPTSPFQLLHHADADTSAPRVAKNAPSLWAKVTLPIDSSKFEVEQIFYKSKDGTRVPMFLVHRKGMTKDGNNPTLLYGYGGFDVSLTPNFRASIYPWLEAGGLYAIANLRGGGGVRPGGGTTPGAALHKQEMSSTTSLRRPEDTWSAKAGPNPRGSASTADRTAACSHGRGDDPAPGVVPGAVVCRVPPPRHASLPPVRQRSDAGCPEYGNPDVPRAVQDPSTPIRPTTTWSMAPDTHRSS